MSSRRRCDSPAFSTISVYSILMVPSSFSITNRSSRAIVTLAAGRFSPQGGVMHFTWLRLAVEGSLYIV